LCLSKLLHLCLISACETRKCYCRVVVDGFVVVVVGGGGGGSDGGRGSGCGCVGGGRDSG
jgi:hypothetical protein